MKELHKWQHIKKFNQVHLKKKKRKVIPFTDFSENQSNPCFYYYWQLPKVSCISINKCRCYPGDNIWHKFNQVPLPKKWSPSQIFLKINPIHAFTITDIFPKFHVYPSTNVGTNLVMTHRQTDGLTGQKHYTQTTLLCGV
jgi:hypothetical protein